MKPGALPTAEAPLCVVGLLLQSCHCCGFLSRLAVSGDRVRNVCGRKANGWSPLSLSLTRKSGSDHSVGTFWRESSQTPGVPGASDPGSQGPELCIFKVSGDTHGAGPGTLLEEPPSRRAPSVPSPGLTLSVSTSSHPTCTDACFIMELALVVYFACGNLHASVSRRMDEGGWRHGWMKRQSLSHV